MRRSLWISLPLLCALPLAASALPQRTFVASNGVDTNPCSLAAPCRSLGTAVTAVSVGGEVIVLDSAAYGAVTVAKSVSIVAPTGIYAGISVFGSAGVTVDGPGIVVVLRGLTINNQGGGDGIEFLQGASLHVENCIMSGFSTGAGLNVQAGGSVTHVLDTIVRNNHIGIVFGAGLAGNLSRTRVENNSSEGIELLGNTVVSIEDSVVSGSTYNIDLFPLTLSDHPAVTIARTLVSGGSYGILAEPNATLSSASVTVMDSTISGASVYGIAAMLTTGFGTVLAIRNQLQNNATAFMADGANAKLILDGNALAGNGTGVNKLNGGVIRTRDNNTANANGADTVNGPFTSLGGI